MTIVRTRYDLVPVNLTFSVDTSAYGSGDLVADSQELVAVGNRDGQVVVLKGIRMVDKADQKVALHFVFCDASTTLGTENSAPGISDANSTIAVGKVTVAATDYVDLGGAAVMSKEVNLPLKLAATSTSLWVAIVNDTGTPTYAAADLVATFYFDQSPARP
jgi:hypothetical protein